MANKENKYLKQSKKMVRLLIVFISVLLLQSCASRKVDISKLEENTKIDSSVVTKTDSIVVTQNNITVTETTEELEVKPIVDSLPIVVNGISYKNAVLRYKKQKKISEDISKKTESKNVLKKELKTKTEVKKTKEKVVDKKANYFIYLWLLIIPIGIIVYREIKKKIFL
jgi:iron uptake system EfeUOB component EfeO/EfeM